MLGEMLKKLRTEAKLSQYELGVKLGVSQQAIGQWEKGSRDPDSTTIKNIANFFNVTTDYLMGNSSGEANNLREVMAFSKNTTLKFMQKLIGDTRNGKVTWHRYSESSFAPVAELNPTLSFFSYVSKGIVFLNYWDTNSVGLSIQFNKEDSDTEINVPYDPEIQKAVNELYNEVYSILPNLEKFFEEYLSSDD